MKDIYKLKERKLLNLYQLGKISLGKVADDLGITKLDGHILLEKNGISMSYSKADFREDTSPLRDLV